MATFKTWIALPVVMLLSGCGNFGKVEQGWVIAFDRQAGQVTLIPEPGVLPPVTIKTPADPDEMGPAPAAGKLLLVDMKARRIVIFDEARQALRTIEYTPVEERRNVAKAPRAPVIDEGRKTITIYWAGERSLVTFAASDDLLALPADTWKAGDVVRYYYKDPGQALRLMNVSRTDLAKAGG